MRVSRWHVLVAAAVLAAAVITPAIALAAPAMLTNEWGQTFLGSGASTTADDDGCMRCHSTPRGSANFYDNTSHGQFAKTGAAMEPSSGSAMYPAGNDAAGAMMGAPAFSLGAGTGLREYLVLDEGDSLFGVPSLEWDPRAPKLWEMDWTKGIEYEAYACNQCHMLGATRDGFTPAALAGASAGTSNAWAKAAGDDAALAASWVPGAGIQCERCHGTGKTASGAEGGHWGTGVKVVGLGVSFLAQTGSSNILKSEVCGQCHGAFKNQWNGDDNTGPYSVLGYTPDATLTDFVGADNLYKATDVPTVYDPASKFFPNGQNKSNKHSYFTEWGLSAHSYRVGYTATSTGSVLPYQAAGGGGTRNTSPDCQRCHTSEGYLLRKGIAIMDGYAEGAGKLGIECAACHISHGDVGATGTTADGEAVGMAVREPEAADGEYSTLGLDLDNQSICEDCHNWRVNVAAMGDVSDVGAPPLATARFNGGQLSLSYDAIHLAPQREIYHARAMLEVTDADWKPATWAAGRTDFMPGATCEQCHMPATRSDFPTDTGLDRYADRSYKRYSHRMFIMRPGDAEAWGLAPWGDSCSPCHAGETQAQLETNLDGWQSAANDLADDANAAIHEALDRGVSAGSVGDAANGEGNLVMRAASNVALFNTDSSQGAHNPPYIQAGLAKAVKLAKSAGGSITVAAPATVGSNALFGVSGVVHNGDNTDAAGAVVELYVGATRIATEVTNDTGNYAFICDQTSGTTYRVAWIRSSQPVSDLSASVAVAMSPASIPPAIDTDLSMSINRQSAKRKRVFTVSGELHAGAGDADVAGATILIQVKKSGRGYSTVGTVVTGADGRYSIRRHQHYKSTYTYRAKFAGTATLLGSSASHRIRIY